MLRMLKYIHKRANVIADEFGYQYALYGVFQLISNPLFYLMWSYGNRQSYDSFLVRLVISLLCIPLLLSKFWPQKLREFLPWYWYATMLYSLPFFFTFMLLKNNFSFGWSLNSLTGFVLIILLLDLASLVIIVPLGILIAWMNYSIITPNVDFSSVDLATIFVTYGSVIIFGALFSHRRETYHQEKLLATESASASMAHELRTPLSTIVTGAQVVQVYVLQLIESYKLAIANKLKVPNISQDNLDMTQAVFKNIATEAEWANSFINMMLVKVKQQHIKIDKPAVMSMRDSIKAALNHYPFAKEERELVHCDLDNDFEFNGDDVLITHVFFNLLKNALYSIKAASKGDIQICLVPGAKYNRVYFKDTGLGISKKDLKHIFERFFSRTRHGTGLGLPFCTGAMKAMSGDIKCRAKNGEFAEFIISFPHVGY